MPADPAEFRPRLLVIDDAVEQADAIADLASELGYDVHTCTDPRSAMLDVSIFQPHAVVLDVMMPEVDGVTLLPMILRALPGVRLLVLSGHGEALIERAMRAAAAHSSRGVSVAQKPLAPADLRRFLGV